MEKAGSDASRVTTTDKEVGWDELDVHVQGTMTRPSGKGPHPGIIFLAGSGPTDRDWCSPLIRGRNGTAKIMAEALAGRGFVTLRFDKLGSGPHAKEELPKLVGKVSMQTFADEVGRGVETLLAEGDVDGGRLFVVANSEGCIHATNYQLQAKANRFRGLVLTGAPGRTVGEVARSQLVDQFNQLHNMKGAAGFAIKAIGKIKPLPDAETTMKHYDEAIAQFLSGKPVTPDPSLAKGIQKLLRSLTAPANQPFSRELWNYDLTQKLGSLDDPILIVIGKKDIQVDWKTDGGALEKAVPAGRSVTFLYPENANHLMKYEKLPREKLNARNVASHYNSPAARLDEEAANSIFSWLSNRAGT
jgi:uncharacterized protein